MTPDDSALLHARAPYDPEKARAYYLRTRHLKGRRAARAILPKGKKRPTAVPVHVRKGGLSRQEQLKDERDKLERRLDRLKEVLAEKVKAAKKRSGIEVKSKAPSKAKKDSTKKSTPDKALTTSQKKEKAAKAREDYKKEHGGGTSTSQEIQQLRKQIADIRAKIKKAVEDAQKSHSTTHPTAPKGR